MPVCEWDNLLPQRSRLSPNPGFRHKKFGVFYKQWTAPDADVCHNNVSGSSLLVLI